MKAIHEKFESYPAKAKKRLEAVRALIFKVAEDRDLGVVTESIKWGEASYSCKGGSPLRIDWKPSNPDQVSVFFNCNTILVETYREIYGNTLELVGKRELALPLSAPLPEKELEECLVMALQYHKLKKLPLLGA